MPKTKLLFLCTGNSCRSQMAEGWTRHLKSETAPEYPPEEGCYLRRNDFSPVTVVVILRWK